MIHELKVIDRFWPDYKSGLKTFSIRKNDRNFAVGDVCIFKLWDENHFVLNEIVVKKITHILHDYDSKMVLEKHCILSLGIL